MEIKKFRELALPVREEFASHPFGVFGYLPKESCMDAPMWMPAGSCRQVQPHVPPGYRKFRPLQRECRRNEWS